MNQDSNAICNMFGLYDFLNLQYGREMCKMHQFLGVRLV